MNHTQTLKRTASITCLVALALLTTGFKNYKKKTEEQADAVKSGNIAVAVKEADKNAAKHVGDKNEIIYRLEQGATLRMAAMANPSDVPDFRVVPKAAKGEAPPEPLGLLTAEETKQHYLTRANEAFDAAQERVDKYEEEAKVKLGSEIGAALTNQGNQAYRGRSYDKVMMNTYKAINYLALGDQDKARVELNRALQRQRDAVAENERRIAAAQEQAAKAARGELKDEEGKSAAYDSKKAQDDPKTGPALQAALNESLADVKPYADYVNPFSVFLDGLYFTAVGINGSDWERGRKSFERVAEMVPENTYAKQDVMEAASVAEGKSLENLTYVIFETGTAVARDQIRIDIPTFIVTSKLAYVGAAFPKLQYNNDYVSSLAITAGDQTVKTMTVASMDSVVATDFKNEWPTIVTKTMITTATKAIIQWQVQQQSKKLGLLGHIGGAVAGAAYGAATNNADTRTWSSLPKEFQYARIATPADRTLKLNIGGAEQSVTLLPGSINVVYVKSTSSSATPLVSQFILK